MLRLYSRPASRSELRKQAQVKLRVEALEERYCLDASALAMPDAWPEAAISPVAVNQPPVISQFSATEGSGGLWTFTGTSMPVKGFVVTFSGLPSVSGKTATVAADGTFVLSMFMNPNENGGVGAVTQDTNGLKSNTALVSVSQTP